MTSAVETLSSPGLYADSVPLSSPGLSADHALLSLINDEATDALITSASYLDALMLGRAHVTYMPSSKTAH
jgi:hypothetical protein